MEYPPKWAMWDIIVSTDTKILVSGPCSTRKGSCPSHHYCFVSSSFKKLYKYANIFSNTPIIFNWQHHDWWSEKLWCDTMVLVKLWCLNCNISQKPRCQVRNVEEFKVIFMKGFRIKILEHLDFLATKETPNFARLHMKNSKGKWVQMTETLWAGIIIVLFQNGWIVFLLCSSRIIRSVSQLVPRREYLESTSWRSCEKVKGFCS